MVAGLPVSSVINVEATLSPLAAPLRNFGIPLFLDDVQGVVDMGERFREYLTLESVAAEWATTSGAYKAAQKFFSQSPRPGLCYIGLWARTATKGMLRGAALSSAQQAIANFTAITSGTLYILVNGVPKTLSGLNFSTATNLNGVAAILQTALAGVSAGATVVWNALYKRFELTEGSSGASSTLSYGDAPRAWGSVTFNALPAATNTVTIQGTATTFVASNAGANQIVIAASTTAMATAFAAYLNASVDANISLMTYFAVGSTVYAVSKLTGTAGNAYTLAAVGANIALSGATLTGGTGTAIATTFGLTQASGARAPIAGAAAETPLAAAQAFVDKSNDWYELQFVSDTQPTDADHLAVAGYIEGLDVDRIYGLSTGTSLAITPGDTSNIGAALKSAGVSRSFGVYSSSSPTVAAASLFGRFATVDFQANASTITAMWKQLPGIVPETLTASQAAALKANNLNAFVAYNNGRAILQFGVMANGDFMDERIGIDWFKNDIQTVLWNLLFQTTTKIPQTDKGTETFLVAVKARCAQARRNGLLAPGVWNGPDIGPAGSPIYKTGDVLPEGFHVYADSYANQAQADREARKGMPIYVAAKFAGAVHTVDVFATFNR